MKKLTANTQAQLWVWGDRDWSKSSFGRHLDPSPTSWGRLCPTYTDVSKGQLNKGPLIAEVLGEIQNEFMKTSKIATRIF